MGTASGNRKYYICIGVFIYLLFTLYVWKTFWLHPGSNLQSDTGDPALTLWSLSAVSKDLSQFKLPFFSDTLWAPYGVNLLDNTTEPLLGIVSFPITFFLGPLWSYLILGTLGTFLNAIAGWYLCSRIVGVNLASYLGGIIAGFNPFLTGAAIFGQFGILYASVPMTGVAALINIYLLKKRNFKYFIILGLSLAAELFLSPELLAIEVTGITFAALFLFVCYTKTFVKELRLTYKSLLGTFCGLAVIMLYPVYFILKGPEHLSQQPWGPYQSLFGVDWEQSVFLPKSVGDLKGFLFFTGYFGPSPGPPVYLGILMFVVLIASILIILLNSQYRFLIGNFLLSVWLTTGAALSWGVNRPRVVSSPLNKILIWRLLSHLPILPSIIPQRFAIMFWITVSMIITAAIKLCWEKSKQLVTNKHAKLFFIPAYLCFLVAFIPIIKSEELPIVSTKVTTPGCFYDFKRAPYRGKIILVLPFPGANGSGQAMTWDAIAGLPVKLVGGYIFIPDQTGARLRFSSASHNALGVLASLTDLGVKNNLSSEGIAKLRTAINTWHVSYIVLKNNKFDFLNYIYFNRVTEHLPKEISGCWVWNVLKIKH